MSASSRLHLMQHDADPKAATLAEIGDISGLTLTGRQVLIAIYRRPGITKGGILLTDAAKDEDLYQGKVGLIVKTGAFAFENDDDHRFGGDLPKVGDWVFFRVADGWCLSVNGRPSRILQDNNIRGIVQHPDMVL